MIEAKKFARRHMGEFSAGKMGKNRPTDGFVATSCLSAGDPSRGTVASRVCSGDVNSAAACPGGYSSFGYQTVGYNWGRACTEVDMVCVKNAYPQDEASITKCCTGETPEKDCDPKFCRGSAECKTRMYSICSGPDGYKKPGCVKWMAEPANAESRVSIMGAAANAITMAIDPIVRSFCRSPEGAGKCDNAALAYCSQRAAAGDPICACINSPLKDLGDAVAPVACFDDACVSSGYKMASQKAIVDRGCPPFTKCSAVINATDQSILLNNKISQACGPGGNYAVSEKERAAMLTQAEAGVNAADAEAAQLAAEEKAISDAEQAAAGLTFADKMNAPLVGSLAAGDAIVIFFVMLILVGVIYWRWTASKKSELKILSGGVEAASRLASQQKAVIESEYARLSGNDAAVELLAGLPRVGK